MCIDTKPAQKLYAQINPGYKPSAYNPIHFGGNLTHSSFFKKINEYLNFSNHIKEKNSKANKGISIIKKFYNFLPRNSGRNSLITIYKSFIQPHLDYGTIIFYLPENGSFC